MINKKILILAFETKLKKIFNNNESIVTKIFENFFFFHLIILIYL